MPGINQLPSGAEGAAAISLIWASASWICSSLLLWLTWAHHEGWSYLALLSMSAVFSNVFSIIQQGRDITWYVDIQTESFERKLSLPPDDPEVAIAGGSFGVDLVLYYLQYYSYNVQAMLVMFWAAELCQLTYQIGERRTIRRVLRSLHVAGKFISWILPLITILCLRIPPLRNSFVAFILVADLPLMISLAVGSSLMIAVLVRYVRTRQKFTQWNPPKYNSTTASEAGTTTTGTQTNKGRRGLYDRWLMVRFTIAFVMLAVFEATNILFQTTALTNDIHDAAASAPDLSAARAIQTLFLYMPGTTPGIFLFVVFGTTASSRRKLADLFSRESWHEWLDGFCCFKNRRSSPTPTGGLLNDGGIHVERSLTITSASRGHSSQVLDDPYSDPSQISMSDLPKRPASARSLQMSYMKPLPLTPQPPSSRFRTTATSGSSSPAGHGWTTTRIRDLAAIEEKSTASDTLTRTNSDDSLRVPDDYHTLGPEHSDDSGPILPIQRQEVRFSRENLYINRARSRSLADDKYSNFSRPGIR
ncbi:hypothetical protein VMCG_08219 [Cytospora schulzeri]|uniref:Uncharacterized protein n=1 Tax=Cytospora schulzeri TaxID=448051 RepID=A0A423VSK1_9PEZI|nr:hypothetical protein VMCG_08219 [Valsa malicola]